MTFSLKNGSNYYEFPINPQTFTFNPSPKIAIQKTIGGTVIQFLGATSQIQATGLINAQNTLNLEGRYAEGGILAQFVKECHLNQKTGQTTLLTYDEEEITDLPVTINDFNLKFDTDTVALSSSLDFGHLICGSNWLLYWVPFLFHFCALWHHVKKSISQQK